MPVAQAALSETAVKTVVQQTIELGRLLVDRQQTVSFGYKADGTVLSELDQFIQRRIHACVRALPDDAAANAHFVGEEEDLECDSTHVIERGRVNWIVDALDGTATYTKGLNSFAISIALLDEANRPLLGLIHLPGIFGRSYLISTHDGALRRYEVSSDGDELGLTALPADAAADRVQSPLSRLYLYANSNVHRLGLERFEGKVRNHGSTAAHLAMLCDGGEDPAAVLLTRCHVWDVAAGLALADSAGLEIREKTSWRRLDYPTALESYLGSARRSPQLVGHPDVLAAMRSALMPNAA